MSVQDQDLGLAQLIRTLTGGVQPSVQVGVRGDPGSDLVTYAAANEFGTEDGHVPERSYLRSTIDENQTIYAGQLEAAVGDLIDGKSMLPRLRRLGMIAKRDVQLKIRELKTPPNAPSTIRKKGSSNPLIDTGRLRNSIDFEVVS